MKSRNIKCIWLIAQGFLHRPDIDYKETYSSMMDTITFRYLICLAISERLDLCLMDVVTAYLYGSLDNDIYVKIPEGFQMPEETNSKYCSIYSIKLQRSLYRLSNPKACGTITSINIWNGKYVYITLFGYASSLCWIFAIITVYVEYLNFFGTLKELTRIVDYLKCKFEMKDHRK